MTTSTRAPAVPEMVARQSVRWSQNREARSKKQEARSKSRYHEMDGSPRERERVEGYMQM